MTKKTSQEGVLVFGAHPIAELLRAKKRRLLVVYMTRPEPKAWSHMSKLLPAKPSVPIQYVARDVLTRIAGTPDHQGLVAYAQPLVIRKKIFDPKTHPLLVMLDGLHDVHNVGAILRSAYCAGFDGAVLIKRAAAGLTAAALKASAGLAERLDIYEAPTALVAAQELKDAGYTIYATTFDGQNAACCGYTKPLCVILGNEATGVSADAARLGKHITLPQKTADISYNASVAGGILLFLIGQLDGFQCVKK